MFPISSTSAPAAVAATQRAVAAAPATAPPAAQSAPASTSVEFSTLAQFLSSVALTRKQLLELQGGAPQPTLRELAVLDLAARELSDAFNQLQVAVTSEPSALDDNANGQLLASRLRQELEQEDTAGGQPLAASTLAAAGLALAPTAAAARSADADQADWNAAAETAPRALLVDSAALGSAFALDRRRTLSVLEGAAQRFAELGDAAARQAADSARQAAAQRELELEQGQRSAASRDQTREDARSLATDPSVAAAIAAYHLGSAAFAGGQARPNPAPPARTERIEPAPPVARVTPVRPAGQPDGDTREPRP